MVIYFDLKIRITYRQRHHLLHTLDTMYISFVYTIGYVHLSLSSSAARGTRVFGKCYMDGNMLVLV